MQLEAQIYLEEIEKYDRFIKSKIAEIEQLRCLATSVTAAIGSERVQTSGTSDKVGSTTAIIVDKENELRNMVEHFFNEKSERIKLIEQVKNPLEYTVLHERYIQYMSLKDIAEEESYSYQYICEVHGRALKNIQIFLNNLYKPIETY